MLKPNEATFRRAAENLRKLGKALAPAMVRPLVTWSHLLAGHVKKKKLAGQVLARVSGRLASSVRPLPPEVKGGTVSVRVQAGTGLKDVAYAAIHEYGGVIQHPGGTAYFFDAKRATAVFISNEAAGEGWPPALRTRPHPIPIPARPYMRPSLEEMRPDLTRLVIQALADAVGKAGRGA